MSLQEQYLKDIADAIRAKGGTSSIIAAKDFANAIRNLPSEGGGGSGGEVTLIDILPQDRDLVCYFDCRVGVTSAIWKNQLGSNDIELYGASVDQDGVNVKGTDSSYAKLSIGGTPGGTISGTEYTIYIVLKKTDTTFSNWRTIIGNETGTNYCSTIAINASGQYQFTRNDIYTSISCADYHVLAWKKSGSYTYLFIDGVLIGSASGASGLGVDTYFGRGSSWYYTDENNLSIRLFARCMSAHSNDEIIQNSQWLMQEYIDAYNADKYTGNNTIMYLSIPTLMATTSDILISGYYNADRYPAYKAFDKSISRSSRAITNSLTNCWLGYKMAHAMFLDKVIITTGTSEGVLDNGNGNCPQNIIIQGSDNNIEWTDLTNIITIPCYTYKRLIKPTININMYQYYRVYIVDSYNTESGYNTCGIIELDFIGHYIF